MGDFKLRIDEKRERNELTTDSPARLALRSIIGRAFYCNLNEFDNS